MQLRATHEIELELGSPPSLRSVWLRCRAACVRFFDGLPLEALFLVRDRPGRGARVWALGRPDARWRCAMDLAPRRGGRRVAAVLAVSAVTAMTAVPVPSGRRPVRCREDARVAGERRVPCSSDFAAPPRTAARRRPGRRAALLSFVSSL